MAQKHEMCNFVTAVLISELEGILVSGIKGVTPWPSRHGRSRMQGPEFLQRNNTEALGQICGCANVHWTHQLRCQKHPVHREDVRNGTLPGFLPVFLDGAVQVEENRGLHIGGYRKRQNIRRSNILFLYYSGAPEKLVFFKPSNTSSQRLVHLHTAPRKSSQVYAVQFREEWKQTTLNKRMAHLSSRDGPLAIPYRWTDFGQGRQVVRKRKNRETAGGGVGGLSRDFSPAYNVARE